MRVNYKKNPTTCNIEMYLFDRSKAELARHCGTTPQAVNWWCKGEAVPNLAMRRMVVEYLADAVEDGLSEDQVWPGL